jgi:DNA-binding MarR family transcriptional regulator
MPEVEELSQLMRMLLRVVGRSAIPVAEVQRVVVPNKASEKLLAAYNRCDGSRTQAQIVKELHLNQASFSRAITRWEAAGVLFRVRRGREELLLHIYPLPSPSSRKNARQEAGNDSR